ncbi:MAG: FtsX-like permease family protein, partial [Merismopedia sp. SIO2A8]|nr:FtsX-like permease family protein [Merismopedia sp. SIO2A8]
LLFALNILLFIVGMFLDAGPAIIILGPILGPIFIGQLGLDPVHFAIELMQLHGKKDFTIVASKSVQDLVTQVTGALSLLLGAIASISLLVGGIGIMNIMLVSVTERTQEIGLRKAVGATQRDILTQFLIEAVILSVAGGVFGTCLGIGGSMVVGMLTPLEPSVPIAVITLAVGVSGGIGLFFGVFPARQAAKLDPIVALHSA